MDPAIVSAMAAVFGSLVGGSATVATAWVTQSTLTKRELLGAEIRTRQTLLRRVHSRMLQTRRGLVYAYIGQAGNIVARL
jgi:class 3 adenylate cyclase